MNKKILIIANDFTTIYNFRLELIKQLQLQGENVILALPQDERNGQLEVFCPEIIDLKISRFGTNPLVDLSTFFSIKKILSKIKPDIVFTFTAKPNIYGGIACRITKTPHVANITGLGSNFEKQNIISKIMLLLQRFAYKKSQMVFFQNKSNLTFFQNKKVIKQNFKILPGSGVNLQNHPFEKFPNNEVTKFITIARIRHDKGYDELFSAIQRLKENDLEAEFHIVGWYEDENYKHIVEKFNNNRNVIFHNGVPHEEIHSLISICDCLIHPSHHEGMSNVILEAAAAGRPAIVSNIPGCIEAVDNNETGFYFQVKNPFDLYDKILNFIKLSTEKKVIFGLSARKKIEAQFNRQIVIDAYLNEINKLP
jgi:galacturonosyltransferase